MSNPTTQVGEMVLVKRLQMYVGSLGTDDDQHCDGAGKERICNAPSALYLKIPAMKVAALSLCET